MLFIFASSLEFMMNAKYEHETKLHGITWDVDIDYVDFKINVCKIVQHSDLLIQSFKLHNDNVIFFTDSVLLF